MVNIAICDDNEIFLKHFSASINMLMKKTDEDYRVFTLSNKSELMKLLKSQGGTINILFMDIDFGDADGITLAKHINIDYPNIIIVYVTAYVEYAKNICMSKFMNFLTKPVNPEQLKYVLNEALCSVDKQKSSVVYLNSLGKTVCIELDSIKFIESNKRKAIFHIADKAEEFYYKISDLPNILGKDFVRCHKSYIVNLEHIRKIESYNIILDDNTQIPLAQKKYKEIRECYFNYISR